MTRYGMVIDLKRCIGCNACTMACKAEHATMPGIFWARVLEKEVGKFPTATRTFLPVLCNHCAEPPCRDVCPSGATTKRENGIVLVDYDKCIGCRACMMACPYSARFYTDKVRYYYDTPTPYEEYGYTQYQVGTVQKCNFCYKRVEEGLDPACVQTCPTSARSFGDLDDSNSQVSKLISERRGTQLKAELGVGPSVYYLE